MTVLFVAAAIAAAGTALIAFLAVLRQAQALGALRLLTEQSLSAARTEAETTRAVLRAVDAGITERITGLRASFDTAIETIRTVLSRQQGEIRVELLDGQRKSAEQIAGQFDTTRGIIDSKLRELREANDSKLADIRTMVTEQLHAAVEKQMNESFNRVIDQFAAVQKAMGDVQAVTAQIGDIKRLFSNVKTRGGWGETQVRAILDDILPADAYETNRKIRPDSDETVEFVVIMPMRGDAKPLLPIDAKFPVEDYERLLTAAEAGDAEGQRAAARRLERTVREQARKIATKYIHPPATVEFAVMYLPTDALYAEVARMPGLIDEIGRDCRVLVLGPSLFPALLRTIHLGFITLALEHKADQVRDLLGATRTEMLKMDDVLERLAKQAGAFSNTIDRARIRTRAVSRKLRSVETVEPTQAASLLDVDNEMLAADEE